MFGAFLHGLLLSFGLILPIGMQNGFVLTQGSVQHRFVDALPTVVTASLCDTMLIAVAVFGASSLASYILRFRLILGVIGIAFLLWMGWKLLWPRRTAATAGKVEVPTPDDDSSGASVQTNEAWSPRSQVGFAMSTSLLNPHAWIDTVAIIGGTALAYTNLADRVAFSIACVGVSWVWFTLLAWVGRVATSFLFRDKARARMNQISGAMMWASAIYLGSVLLR